MVKYHIYFHNSSNQNKEMEAHQVKNCTKIEFQSANLKNKLKGEKKLRRLTFKQNVTACRLYCNLPV